MLRLPIYNYIYIYIYTYENIDEKICIRINNQKIPRKIFQHLDEI